MTALLDNVDLGKQYRHQDLATSNENVSLVDFIQGCVSLGREFYQAVGVYDEWRTNYTVFRGRPHAYVHVDKGAQWRSTVVPPEGARMVFAQLPRVVRGMMPHRNYFGVWDYKANANYEKLGRAVLSSQLRQMKFPKNAIMHMMTAGVLGHAHGKVTWDVDVEDEVRDELMPVLNVVSGATDQIPVQRSREKISFAGARFSTVNNFRVLQDPTGAGSWWNEEIPTTVEALNEVNRRIPGTYMNMDVLRQKMAFQRRGEGGPMGVGRTDRGGPFQFNDAVAQFEGAEDLTQRPWKSGSPVLLWQWWGWVPPYILDYGDDNTQWRLVVVADGQVVLRDVPAPTHNHRPPYFNSQWIPMFGRLFGLSHLAFTRDVIHQMVQLDRSRIDEILNSLSPQMVINRDVNWQNLGGVRQLGGIVEVRGLGQRPVSDAFTRMEVKPVLTDVWRERASLKGQLDEFSGVNGLTAGLPQTSHHTRGEFEMLLGENSMQFALVSAWNNLTTKAEVLERSWGLCQRFMTDDQIVRLVDGDEQMALVVNWRDLQDDIDIIVDEGLWGPWGHAKAAVLASAMQAGQAEPFASWIKPKEYFGEWLEAMDIPNADRLLWTEKQMEQRQRDLFNERLRVAGMAAQAQGGQGQASALAA